ncbi:MAG: hypothetical protein WCP06_13325 [Verrucomicrobiota bacterium]
MKRLHLQGLLLAGHGGCGQIDRERHLRPAVLADFSPVQEDLAAVVHRAEAQFHRLPCRLRRHDQLPFVKHAILDVLQHLDGWRLQIRVPAARPAP